MPRATKQPKDPYKTLKVSKKASKKDIQQAFRQKARETHPDAGGTPEEFQEVQQAYKLLMDDSRRQRYDTTGDSTEREPDNSEANILSVVMNAFFEVANSLLQQGIPADRVDFISHIKQFISKRNIHLREEKQAITRMKLLVEKCLGRFKTKDNSPNAFEPMLKSHLGMIESDLARKDAEEAMNNQALEMISRYRFEFEKRAASATTSTMFFQGWSSPSSW